MHNLFIKKYLTQSIVLYPFLVTLGVCLDQRINCYKEIAKYTYPRLKLQELWVSPVENLAPTVIKLVAGTGSRIKSVINLSQIR